MRLLVHSLWQCNHDNCHGFPLHITLCEGDSLEERRKIRGKPDLTAAQVIVQELDAQLVLAMLEKIVDYDVFKKVARDLGLVVPENKPTDTDNVHEINQLHHAMFEFHIIEALLTCPECGHEYPVTNGIPDFVQEATDRE